MIEQRFEERGGFGQKGGTKAHAFTERAFLLCTISQRNRKLAVGQETPGRGQQESVYVLQGKTFMGSLGSRGR